MRETGLHCATSVSAKHSLAGIVLIEAEDSLPHPLTHSIHDCSSFHKHLLELFGTHQVLKIICHILIQYTP